MDLSILKQKPEGVAEALVLGAALDEALMTGFSRLPESTRDALGKLADALGGTPLGAVAAEAVGRVLRSEFSVASCLGLAAARSALMGAVHDALRAQVSPDAKVCDATEPLAAGDHAPLLSGVQQWLAELAVAGLEHLSEAQLLPFAQILAQVQSREELAGQAALLAGFYDELILSNQQKNRGGLPSRRWADLWCAALLGAQNITPAPAFAAVSGRLHPCGLDVREHRSFVMATLWGLLEADGAVRVVRWPFVSWKVSVLDSDETWRLFGTAMEPVLGALASGQTLELKAAELSAAGDLRVTEMPVPGGAANIFELPQPWIAHPSVRAAVRHPAHLSELVRLEPCSVSEGAVTAGGVAIPLAMERLASVAAEVGEKQLAAASGMIGLLRWDDDNWRLQPLAIRGAGKLKGGLRVGQGISGRLAKLKTETMVQLQERASRLLRA